MYLFPAGGQRGTTVKFHSGGLYLNQSCLLEMIGPGVQASPVARRTESPWFEGPILPLPESQRQEDYPRAMAGSVAIARDAAAGDRYVLLRTDQGITSPLRFVVGEHPEVVEDELPGEPVPVAVKAPVTINGRIFPHEDIDVWTVRLRNGQWLSAMVDAGRIGSPLVAKLVIRDPSGKVVAEADAPPAGDPRLRVQAAADGDYQVSITDARADGGPAFVYRLALTTEADSNRSGSRQTSDRAASRKSGDFRYENSKRQPANDGLRTIREGDAPDPVRGNFLPVPAAGEGCIAAAGEVDRWAFSARKGEALEIELQAAGAGSPLLGILTLTDASGKELARAEPGAAPAPIDPVLRFSAPADGMYMITVQDRFRSRGGPTFVYRICVTRPSPNFDLSFTTLSTTVVRGQQAQLKINVRRLGSFNGPIALTLDGLPAGMTIPKEIVIPSGQPSAIITLKAETNAKVDGSLVRVRGTGMISLAPFSSMFVPVSRSATWSDDSAIDQLRLAVAVPTPFKIAGDYELRLIPRGTVYKRKYRIERNGFTGPIEIDLADKQARHLQGVTGPKFIVPGDKSEFEYPITLPPWMETGRTCRVCVMGTATIRDADGTEHVLTYSSREQNDQIIAVVEPERLGLRIERPTVLAEPGKSVEVQFELRRGDGLKGAATVEVLVPRGIRGVSAQPVKIAADAETGMLKLHLAPDIRGPFPSPLTLRATVLDGDRPVTAERKLELVSPR
jgi:hypothetical protein